MTRSGIRASISARTSSREIPRDSDSQPMNVSTLGPPIHPGDILAEELAETAVTPTELARQLKVPANRMTQIIQGKRSITGDTALRLAHWFGMSAQFWLNLQGAYDIRVAAREAGAEIRRLPTRPRVRGEVRRAS